jgi:hypothetical protein
MLREMERRSDQTSATFLIGDNDRDGFEEPYHPTFYTTTANEERSAKAMIFRSRGKDSSSSLA